MSHFVTVTVGEWIIVAKAWVFRHLNNRVLIQVSVAGVEGNLSAAEEVGKTKKPICCRLLLGLSAKIGRLTIQPLEGCRVVREMSKATAHGVSVAAEVILEIGGRVLWRTHGQKGPPVEHTLMWNGSNLVEI